MIKKKIKPEGPRIAVKVPGLAIPEASFKISFDFVTPEQGGNFLFFCLYVAEIESFSQ